MTTRDSDADGHIYLGTSSKVKLEQYRTIFLDLGIEVRRGTTFTTMPEPQFDDADTIESTVGHPLRIAARFAALNKQIPYVVEDTMLVVATFSSKHQLTPGGLPGADTKRWWANLGDEGLLDLMEDVSTRTAMFFCQMGVYLGGAKYRFTRSELHGAISREPRVSQITKDQVPASNPFYFHSIFVPDGSAHTLAEMDGARFRDFDYRRRCAESLAAEIRDHQAASRLQLEFGI